MFFSLFVGVENKLVKGLSIGINLFFSDFTVLYKFASFLCHASTRKWVIKCARKCLCYDFDWSAKFIIPL